MIRFLRRAVSNLQQDIQVVLPNRQLPLQDRRRILSHQLGEFIHCYNKVLFKKNLFNHSITVLGRNGRGNVIIFTHKQLKTNTLFFFSFKETEHLMTKQEDGEKQCCVNQRVFQEYITAARLVNIRTLLPLFNVCFLIIYSVHTCLYCLFTVYSENDLEEVLTFYTQKSKSATVFLGTKARSVKKDVQGLGKVSKCKFCYPPSPHYICLCCIFRINIK